MSNNKWYKKKRAKPTDIWKNLLKSENVGLGHERKVLRWWLERQKKIYKN